MAPLLTRDDVAELLRKLLVAYSEPGFQEQLAEAIWKAGNDRLAQARARREICFTVEGPVLKSFGFEPTRLCWHMVLQEVSSYDWSTDAELEGLSLAIAALVRAHCYAPTVEAAARAAWATAPLPPEALPHLLNYFECIPTGQRYEPVEVSWQGREELRLTGSYFGDVMAHEVTQCFARLTPEGESARFRLHRFSEPPCLLSPLRGELVGFALACEQRAADAASAGTGAQTYVSNIGGFHSVQDVFKPDCDASCGIEQRRALQHLRDVFSTCLQQAAELDTRELSEEGSLSCGAPCLGSDLVAWANVSRSGAMNCLHDHGTARLSAVYYAQARGRNEVGGSLLLRLPADTEAEGHGLTRYVEVPPQEGTLLIFPGWLPHSVAPHFGDEPRISFAANWTQQLEGQPAEEEWDPLADPALYVREPAEKCGREVVNQLRGRQLAPHSTSPAAVEGGLRDGAESLLDDIFADPADVKWL